MSLDAYRGLIMLVMASGGFGFGQIAKKLPDSVWPTIAHYFEHIAWTGGVFWDMIQPSFMFMVGVAMPYSYARRRAEGHSRARQTGHALVRALVLVLLGLMLYSQRERTYVFTNVLAQIGLGYAFVFLLLDRSIRVQLAALAVILVGYWLLFATHPLPPPDFDFAKVGVKKEVLLSGFFAHWNMNANFASDFDRWFLNLLPQSKPFEFNAGGYNTLNFVPSMATTILGLMAGQWLRSEMSAPAKFQRLVMAGAACMAIGLIAGYTVCPIVKKIWTPSWALYSAGWTFWMLAAFYWIIDIRGWRAWSFPLVVVGMNSIAIYLMAQLIHGWIVTNIKIHLGAQIFSGAYGPIWERCSALFVMWLACWWMYRRKIFIRI